MKELKRTVIDVGGEQVFTADYVFTQTQAQSCRIDRAKTISVISVVIAILSLAACIYLMQLVH